MKKVMLYLLVFGFILGVPFNVDASTEAVISNTPASSEKSEDGKTVVNTYEIYIKTTENESLSEVEFEFEYGAAITKFECADGGNFKVFSQDITGENAVNCTFAVPNDGDASGEKILVGKVVVNAKADAPDEDCQINYSYDGATGKINPPTGVNIPYAIIAGGLVLAAGVYFVTKKKTALYKI